MMTKKGGDAKFFSTTKKGEVAELKMDLNSLDRNKVKDAVKKTIAAMTVGKDVSGLFTDVVKSMQTDNLELKKLVYLYIINYARAAPDKAILVVNTFQKDASHASPLIRALAIRTMGCIRVDRIMEYLGEPLANALRDKDPYVRKTGAIAVAKLYDMNKELVEEKGFIDSLRGLLSDPNPMVVANSVAALSEISESSGVDQFRFDVNTLSKLLTAINEASEWGQVFILDCLATYEPPSAKEAEDVIERVSPRLKHANAAVVMSAVKVIMKYLDYIKNPKLEAVMLNEKLPPPLITLLSEHKPEVQYVALRNINLVVQKHPNMLTSNVKHFFVKYNDPIYVKMEKLDIMIKLANVKNIEKVLMEFKEYASEVDVEFVRKAVLAIGRCAIKIEQAAERCVQVLLELIQTKVNYVVQEAIIVIKDIFRKYPNKYESIIATLCENLESLDEPDAKAAMIWIIGEYADRIDNAPELLESFVEHWEDENSQVQLQLLTAVVKLFLKRPEDAKELVGKVLQLATQNADNPDLRDRGYVYWRLLSTDPEAAQQVVLCSKPTISDDTFQMDSSLLNSLLTNLGSLASVYHKPPTFFVKDAKHVILKQKGEKKGDEESDESEEEEEGEGDGEGDGEGEEDDEEEEEDEEGEEDNEGDKKEAVGLASSGGGSAVLDLLGLGAAPAAAASAAAASPSPKSNNSSASASGAAKLDEMKVSVTFDAGKGLQIRSRVARRGGQLFLDLLLDNNSTQTLSNWAIKFNENYAGVQPNGALAVGAVAQKESKPFALGLSEVKPLNSSLPSGLVQIAIKTDLGVFYWNQPFQPYHLFEDAGKLSDSDFLGKWKALPDESEKSQPVNNRTVNSVDDVRARFESRNAFYIASRITNKASGASAVYFSARLKGQVQLIEIKLDGGNTNACVKSENNSNSQLVLAGVAQLLTL